MIVKYLVFPLVMLFAMIILDLPHYKIAGFYDVNVNIALMSMFWYGIYYGANL